MVQRGCFEKDDNKACACPTQEWSFYVSLECDESAVLLCLVNAAQDRVEYCREHSIEFNANQWPASGFPHELITDKGSEFFGFRMQELHRRFGVEIQSLPPFRPDGKGLVEKSFDLIQQRYKPLLRGKGVIEPDAQEQWSTDYRNQSVLTVDEFTKIVIHCVLYINSGRILTDAKNSGPEVERLGRFPVECPLRRTAPDVASPRDC